MNILIVVDKIGSAIHRLANSVEKHNKHFNIKVIPLHPKRNGVEDLFQAQEYLKWADLVDVHYWKSGEVLRTSFPVDFEKKKKIVCHFNPYDLEKLEWKKFYEDIVVGNGYQAHMLPYAKLIPYGIDLDFFEFKAEYTDEPIINMSVGRIESKKGVREVAQACNDLGYQFHLVGRVSDVEYMREVVKAGGKSLTFFENATDAELREHYYQSMIHVCNSVDGFESGTLPILEAMACGVPVLTRKVGHVPDLFNGNNMVIREGKDDDLEDLKLQLKNLVENKDLRLKLRDNAFNTVKNRYDQKMARQFSTLYYRTLQPDKPLVSVIMPTKDRGEAFADTVVGALKQSYDNMELIVVDSGEFPVEPVIRKLRENTKVPIKYIHFKKEGYTLAEARNRGAIEAEGEILVFCDDRLLMDKYAVEEFAKNSKINCWLWGVKDGAEKTFVENFASIRREDFIRAGMFNERIEKWGAMSQEVRTRFTQIGYAFSMVKEATAKAITRTTERNRKRKEIIFSKFLLFKMYGQFN